MENKLDWETTLINLNLLLEIVDRTIFVPFVEMLRFPELIHETNLSKKNLFFSFFFNLKFHVSILEQQNW